VLRLGLVAAARERGERGAAQQAHAVLRVAYAPARHELEEQARESIGDPAMRGHRGEVAEAVADHELRAAPGGDEGGDQIGGMLAVGVDHEDGVGAAGELVDACAHGRALAALAGQADELRAGLVGDGVERAGDVRVGAVVDDHEAGDLGEHLVHVLALGNVAV
jgi:hypothetical protein